MKSKGMTLIALVITIVVLLILAGITIGTLTSDNGVIEEAKTAKELAEKAGVEEQIEIAIIKAEQKYRNPTLYDIIEELQSGGIITDPSQVNSNTGAITTDSNYVIEGKLDDYKYDEIKPYGLGDINNDGRITIEDAVKIQEYMDSQVTFTEDQKLRADTNKDGKITEEDVLEIQQYLLNPVNND